MFTVSPFLCIDKEMVKVIEAAMKKLEKKFCDLVYSTKEHMITESIDVKKLCHDVTVLPTTLKVEHKKFIEEKEDEISKAEEIDKVFRIANKYWDFLNYSLLQHIIEKYGSDEIQSQMKAFAEEIRIFRRNTLLKPFSKVYKRKPELENEKEMKKLISVHKRIELATATLEVVENFRQEFCSELSLYEFSLQLAEIQDGCMMLTWLVSKSLVAYVQKTIKLSSPTMKTHNVSFFIVDGFVAYYSFAGN